VLIILSILFVFTYGATVTHGTVMRAGIGDRPMIYNSNAIQGIVTLFFLINLILFPVMLILNWKLFLILFIPSLFLGGILKKIFEVIVILPMARSAYKKIEKDKIKDSI
jgi:ABC-type bacteriocin/lantibiotic exporter with double-glycine peptidase domain